MDEFIWVQPSVKPAIAKRSEQADIPAIEPRSRFAAEYSQRWYLFTAASCSLRVRENTWVPSLRDTKYR